MELFKLLGTIAIDNAGAKKSLKETGEEGEKAESKLSKAFSGIGKGAAAVGKTVATGLAVGAGAVATLGGFAIKAYADYEQLAGGAKLLFGEAYGYIEEQAKNAYKTVQMSTNDYLQQVNGFSTGLKAALGGNEQAAAELAHKIVVAEADIVAATGNSAENIQNAFNGIMKSNFTMLDNLQLGITPTKEGFQEVIDKVNEWNAANGEATKYQIDNLADCQSALIDYIEMQGISGYATKEAAGTIQGSLAMTKSAWENLMTGLSDPDADLSALINNVFESVTTFAGNLIPRISQVLTGIATSFQTLVPMLAAEIPNLLNQLLPPLIEGAVALVNGLVSALPSVFSALMSAVPSLIEGIMTVMDSLIGALPQLVEMLVSALPTLLPQIIEACIGIIMMLVEMLPQIIQPIIDYLPQIITSIVEVLLANLPVLIQGFIQLVGALVSALPQIFSALIQSIGGIFSGIWEAIKGIFAPVGDWFSNMWNSLGSVPGLSNLKQMIEEVWGAIKNHITTVVNAIKTVISTVWNSIKNVISTVINSIKNVISTVWNSIKTIISSVMKLISSVLKGDWEGVKSAISSILNAIKNVISSIWNGIKNTISSVLNGIKNVISSVWNGIKNVVSSALNTVKSVISSVWNGIKGTISNVVNGVKTTVTTGFNAVKDKVINAFKNLPGKLKSVGKNLVEGLWNGINNAKDWVLGKIKGFGDSILKGIKGFFGIKSPSTVMRDEVGRELARGVAVGIEQNTSKVVASMEGMGKKVLATAKSNLKKGKNTTEDLNKEILKAAKNKLEEYQTYNELTAESEAAFWDEIRTICNDGTQAKVEADKMYFEAKNRAEQEIVDSAEKRLEEYRVYNNLTLAAEIAFWDGIRQECTEGTQARIDADKRYFEAKKQINDEILKAEQKLQADIEAEYQKIEDRTRELMNATSYDEALSFEDLEKNLQKETKKIEQWGEAIEVLEEKIGGTKLLKDLLDSGMSGALNKAYELAFGTTDEELERYTRLYDEKFSKANLQATKELSDEVASGVNKAQTEFYTTCQTLGVDISDEFNGKMSTMVTSITDALSGIKTAFENFEPKMKLPHFTISGEFDVENGTVPTASIEWYAKAMNTPMLLNKPTIFGYNPSTGNYMGGGEAGAEIVGGASSLMNMIQNAVSEQNSAVVVVLSKILNAILSLDAHMGGNLREALEGMGFDVNQREFARLVKAVN